MKKSNEDEIYEAETVAIVSEQDESNQKSHFWSRRPRNENGEKEHHGKNTLSSGTKKSMLTRILSAIVGLAILVPAIFLGGWVYFGFISFALLIACYEILGCTNKRTIVTVLVYFLFVAIIAYWPIFRAIAISGIAETKIEAYYMDIYLPILVVVFGMFFVFFLTVIYKDFTVQDACFLIAMALLVGFGFQCLFYLRFIPYKFFPQSAEETWAFTFDGTFKLSLLLVFVIFSTFMTDTGAYFVGVFFGKNKMNERISPKKTWEGFVGGVVISFLLSATLGILLAYFNYPIIPQLNLNDGWYYILIISFIIPFFATLGDFVFSSIKRYWGIKDYGKLIPGHGGVLDRLDSIIFAVIITSIFIFMLSNIVDSGFNWEQFLV